MPRSSGLKLSRVRAVAARAAFTLERRARPAAGRSDSAEEPPGDLRAEAILSLAGDRGAVLATLDFEVRRDLAVGGRLADYRILLMTRFYRHLLVEGQPPATALRAAQAVDDGWDAVRPHWAGFVLQGDWR